MQKLQENQEQKDSKKINLDDKELVILVLGVIAILALIDPGDTLTDSTTIVDRIVTGLIGMAAGWKMGVARLKGRMAP